jgi:calcyphosin
MQFTPQQLSGGLRFGRGVLIGNWSEDSSLEAERSKDFEARRSHGDLLIKRQERIEAIAKQSVPWSHSADGFVHYGDSVMLRIDETDFGGHVHSHFLACNVWEDVNRARGTKQASASPDATPVARSVFVIVKRPSAGTLGATAALAAAASTGRLASGSASSSDVLCYGDRFCLSTNPSLRADASSGVVAPPMFLGSDRPNNVLGSGRGSKQEVYLESRPSILTEWKVSPADGNVAKADGTPVPAGEAVVLVHCQTNQPLGASISEPAATSFGPEIMLHAFFHQPLGVVGPGKPRPARELNRWHFVYSADPSTAKDTRSFRPLTGAAIMERVREALKARGTYGIRALGKAFRILDDRGDGKLDREDFKWGLFDYGVRLSDEEFDLLLDEVDTSGDGMVSFDEFLVAVRGPLSERRLAVIDEAYDKLDRDGSGTVTLEDLRGSFNARFDEGVRTGKRTEEQALAEFIGQWDTIDKDGVITREEFRRYYVDVSASVDSDAAFETILRKAWRLPGADDAAAAAGLARGKWVEVTLKSGGKKQVFLKGAHTVGDTDHRRIMDALDDAGVYGVATVRALPELGTSEAAQ